MRKYLFADEAGDFAFTKHARASRYFIICTITVDDCDLGHELLKLRRELAWERAPLTDYFHATTEKQAVRDRVYALIQKRPMRIDATILEKSKAHPRVRPDEKTFYQYGWFYHLKHVAPRIIGNGDELMVTAASLGTNKGRAQFKAVVNNVVQQLSGITPWIVNFWPAGTDPCLQIADYCTWAIQRKWESNDSRSYELIKTKIKSEFDLWSHGVTHYY